MAPYCDDVDVVCVKTFKELIGYVSIKNINAKEATQQFTLNGTEYSY